MMCKHEFVEAQGTKMDYEKNDNGRIETLIRRKVCWKCYKTKTEIELEQQLAAANARIVELTENQLSPLELAKLYCKLKELEKRAEQAEAQCAAMRNCHNCKNYDMQWDNDGDWVQRCKHNDTEHDACGKLMKWEAEGNG